jgi:hypothetical protein
VDGEDIRSSGLVQVNDVYTDLPLWCASGPISRGWIVPTCLEANVGRLPQEVLLEEFYRRVLYPTRSVGTVVLHS